VPCHPTAQGEAGLPAGKEILWGCTSMEPYFLVNLLGSVISGIAAHRMVLPSYVRGAEGFTCSDEANMPRGCVSEARDRLVARHQARVDRETGESGKSWTGAGKHDGTMHALQQAWFTAPPTGGKWLQAVAVRNTVYNYTLHLTDEECPAGNFHGLDLILLCKPEDEEEQRWVDGAFGRADGARVPSVHKVGDAMTQAWTDFAKSGTPGHFLDVEWPRFPKQMILASSPSVKESDLSVDSEANKIWNETMAECGINPRQGQDFAILPCKEMVKDGTAGSARVCCTAC